MKFSFIIPFYNTVQYLNECIQSVLRQSYQDYEVILIDDGSTDGSEKLCKEYESKYPQIKVIHQTQAGVSAARNLGIRVAQGEYFIFIDSDDLWIEDKLGLIAEKTEDQPDIIVFEHQTFYKTEELSERKTEFSLFEVPYECRGEQFLEIVLTEAVKHEKFYHWNPWSYCYKRSFFLKNNFQYPEGMTFEDLRLTYQVILAACKVTTVSEVVYGYRKSVNTSITKTYNYKNIDDRLTVCIQNMNNVKNNHKISNRLRRLLWDHFCEQYFMVLTISDLPATRKQRHDIMNKLKKNIWISKYSLRKNDQFIAKLIDLFGIRFVCVLLHARRKIIYHGLFKRTKK